MTSLQYQTLSQTTVMQCNHNRALIVLNTELDGVITVVDHFTWVGGTHHSSVQYFCIIFNFYATAEPKKRVMVLLLFKTKDACISSGAGAAK